MMKKLILYLIAIVLLFGIFLTTYSQKGTIYSSIKGTDRSDGKNFGNFSIIEGKDELGVAGILGYKKDGNLFFEFPLPKTIEGNKITGEFYEITLNEDWKIVKENDGNMSIIKN